MKGCIQLEKLYETWNTQKHLIAISIREIWIPYGFNTIFQYIRSLFINIFSIEFDSMLRIHNKLAFSSVNSLLFTLIEPLAMKISIKIYVSPFN